MAIDANVFSSKQFELFIADQTTMGSAESTNGNFCKFDVVSVSDVDFGGGLVQERNLRSGQQVKKSTDHYVSQKGATASLSFEWVVSHKEGLDVLLKLISEDTSSPYVWTGTTTQAVYNHGATTGKYATVIVSNPNTGDDRLLTELTLSMDSGSEGGRLVASGTFMTGYKPDVSSNAVAPSMSTNAYVKTLYDLTTKTVGGSDVVVKSLSLNIAYPATRIGYQGNNGDVEQYARGGEIVCSGSVSVKYDANTDQELADFLSGATNALSFSDSSPTLALSVPTAVYTGYNLDLGDSEEGVFVEIPFEGTADAGANLYSITTG